MKRKSPLEGNVKYAFVFEFFAATVECKTYIFSLRGNIFLHPFPCSSRVDTPCTGRVNSFYFLVFGNGISLEHFGTHAPNGFYIRQVGFGHACAPVRCVHPSFWVH